MSKIILFNMITLDGFFEGADREIDWHNVDSEFNDFAIDQLNNASALIFGRITYELMAAYWPSPEALGDDPRVAGKMNSIPKIVFSKSLKEAKWNNTKLVSNDIAGTCKNLREKSEKDIYVFGSADLASTLIKLNLIDEFRIMLNPILLGKGNPLFKSLQERKKLKLKKTTIFSSGNVLLCYDPA